jgi:DNA polymerase elongation subunit (family B)
MRILCGTWGTLEVQKAVELGYRILKIYEIWHFENSEKYDPETKSGGIFTEYINTFLKGKQEASGFPNHIKTEQDKRAYIKNYYDKERVNLDYDKIQKNPAQRTCYKLCLNSMWGRLGMNCDRYQYKLINDPKEWYEMITDDTLILGQVDILNENSIQVFYKKKFNEESTETSVTHAAFVTCHARLKLYSELEKINKRVLYFDTDSIIFVANESDYVPELGDYLGEFTNEIDDDDYIVEFVSAGPKNYSYLTKNGKSDCERAPEKGAP